MVGMKTGIINYDDAAFVASWSRPNYSRKGKRQAALPLRTAHLHVRLVAGDRQLREIDGFQWIFNGFSMD